MGRELIEKLLADRSFVLWIKNKGTEDDKNKWEAWLKQDDRHGAVVEEARRLLDSIRNEFPMPDIELEVQKLESTIARYEERQHNLRAYQSLSRSNRWAIAAGLLLLISGIIGTYTFYYSSGTELETISSLNATSSEQYHTSDGETITLRLSDESLIVLNANSSLRFPSKSIARGSDIEVWLEGEAYFDITHLKNDKKRTFTVHTNDGSIQVLGTRFAVKTSSEGTRAVLVEGKIGVRVNSELKNGVNVHTLLPGKMARFSLGVEEVIIKDVNTLIYTSWIDNRLVFENTPLRDVIQRVEDTFGVQVKVNEKLAEKNLTGSIKSTNLEIVMEALSKILNTDVKISEEVVFIGFEQE